MRKSILLVLYFFVMIHAASAQIITNKNDTSHFYYFREQVKDLTFFINLDPDKPKNYIDRGCYKISLLDYNGALADFNKAIDLDSNSVDALTDRGFLYLDYEKFDLSIKDLDRAIRLDPTETVAYLNKGRDLTELKKYNEAIINYTNALRYAPSASQNYNSYFYIGKTYRLLNMPDSALRYYTSAIASKPDFKEAFEERGATYYLLDELDSSLSDYNKAVELGSVWEPSYYNKGLIEDKVKADYRQAIIDLTKAIRLDPTDSQAYIVRADAKLAIADTKGCCADLRMALKLGNASAGELIKQYCK